MILNLLQFSYNMFYRYSDFRERFVVITAFIWSLACYKRIDMNIIYSSRISISIEILYPQSPIIIISFEIPNELYVSLNNLKSCLDSLLILTSRTFLVLNEIIICDFIRMFFLFTEIVFLLTRLF